jgi:glycosyltransferase involved in cell wall biosynthesis
MPAGSVEVIANGLAVPDPSGDAASLARWGAFAVPEGAFVVGAVMRFDDNKRPLLWLDVAAKILRRTPDARFVLVGEGPLLQRAQRRAEELGLVDKVLFTGRSQHVGFWLSKMDVFLLLSRHEGLPNVLIEAQMRGVPVVSTPAGGAGETMRQGETGILLPSVSDVDADAVVQAVLAWRQEPTARASTGETIAEWAVDCFSVESMLASTATVYLGPEARPFAEAYASGW